MGGSEEAVYYTSMELARQGYEVVVYAGVTEADHNTVHSYGAGSVTWLHYDYYNHHHHVPRTTADHGDSDDDRCEIFVAWRYAISLSLATQSRRYRQCGRKYLWLHDLIPGYILPPSFFLHFDGILVQSDFHKSFVLDAFSEHAKKHAFVDMQVVANNIAVLPNGISNLHSMDGANANDVFVYGSAPGRGLAQVLSQWSTIKAAIPTATLEVYYGFTPSAVKELRATYGEHFEAWYAQMQRYLQQDGVKYFGSVDHETLTAAYSRAGMFLFTPHPPLIFHGNCSTRTYVI